MGRGTKLIIIACHAMDESMDAELMCIDHIWHAEYLLHNIELAYLRLVL